MDDQWLRGSGSGVWVEVLLEMLEKLGLLQLVQEQAGIRAGFPEHRSVAAWLYDSVRC